MTALVAWALMIWPVGLVAETREPIDVALVLAADISFSIGPAEQNIQRKGYEAAFRDPNVIAAITGGLHGRIAVIYLEWAGSDATHLIAPWTLIDGGTTAEQFATVLETSDPHRAGRTSISAALKVSASLLGSSPFLASRRIIDVSGAGTSNDGAPVLAARLEALEQGNVINALPILSDDKDLRLSLNH